VPRAQFRDGETVRVARTGQTELDSGWEIVRRGDVLIVSNDEGEFTVSVDRENEMRQGGFRIVKKKPGYIVKKEGAGEKAFTDEEMLNMNPRQKPQLPPVPPRPVTPRHIEHEQKPIHPLDNPPWPQMRLRPTDQVSIMIEGRRRDATVMSVEGDEVVVITWQKSTQLFQRATFALDQIQAWNAVRPTAKRQPFKIGQEVYVRRSNSVVERGWFIAMENNKLVVTNGTEVKSFDPSNTYHLHELEIEGNLPNCLKLDEGARIVKKKSEALRKGSKMTEEEFKRDFEGSFEQGKLGNCFLVSALNSLKMSTHCEAVIRTSVRRVSGGWEVGIPLGTSLNNQSKVFVADNLVDKPFSQTVIRSDGSRKTLQTMRGPIGWRVLEAAYILHTAQGHFYLASINEGGHGDEALIILFGQGVNQERICNTIGRQITQAHAFSDGDRITQREVTDWLNNFSHGKDIATVGTIHTGDDRTSYKVDGIKFWKSHAYSVKSVDKYRQIVVVVNPHNTSQSITLTYDQFMRAFATVEAVNFDYNNMFRGMTGVHQVVRRSR